MKEAVRRVLVALGVRELILGAAKRMYPPEDPWVRQVLIDGNKFLALANEDVGRRIFALRAYEPRDAATLCSLIRPEDVCLDVGANTGYYSVLMAARAGRGTVRGFEPTALNYHLASAAVALNGFTHARIERLAVGDKVGEVEFSEAVDGAYSSVVAVGRSAQLRTVRVPMTTLDAYCSEQRLARVDVLKVDVEGAEGLVLDGAPGLMARSGARPRVIMMELVDRNLEPYGLSVGVLVERLRALGYSPHYAPQAGQLEAFTDAQVNVHQNVFFIDRVEQKAMPEPMTGGAAARAA